MIRTKYEDGLMYVCADDLATAIFNISDGLSTDRNLNAGQRHIASYVAERLALAIVGGNLADTTIVGDDFAP